MNNNLECGRCNKSFTSAKLFNKHFIRKTSCGEYDEYKIIPLIAKIREYKEFLDDLENRLISKIPQKCNDDVFDKFHYQQIEHDIQAAQIKQPSPNIIIIPTATQFIGINPKW